ncbi:MAG TPA: FAD-dependent oxidoreductase, partial [bacterium]|nr:FAD-dependent oxidoreductase [bacterium]
MKSSSPKIIIIGGVAAGPAAAAKAKRINPRAEVVLFEQGEHISYGSCAMPYFIGDVIPEAEKLIHFTPVSFEKEKGCAVRIFHRAEAIWPHRRRVVMRNLQTDQIAEYTYDELILATGARARVPDPAWFRYDNVFAVRSLSDSMRIKNYLASRRPSTAVIIGGGFIGMEMAEALRRHAMHVTVLHKSEWPMDSLELSGRRVVADELKRQGV